MKNNIFQRFNELNSSNTIPDSYYLVEDLPVLGDHKLGISHDHYPIFFVKCKDSARKVDIGMEFISVQYCRKCVVRDNDCQSTETYTLITLKSDNLGLQRCFIDILYNLLDNFGGEPTVHQLFVEIDKLIELFKPSSLVSLSVIKGLWAELLIIDQSSSPEDVLKAWHASKDDKYDFNDGVDKLEVKSTSRTSRIHHFSLEQLNPNSNSQLIIASLFVVQTGVGTNILMLRDSIMSKLTCNASRIKIDEIILKTLGCDFDEIEGYFFDYQLAIDSLAYYRNEQIPTIHNTNIPLGISNVHFDVDLSNIAPTNTNLLIGNLYKFL